MMEESIPVKQAQLQKPWSQILFEVLLFLKRRLVTQPNGVHVSNRPGSRVGV
jgi:hypothetical protein